MMAHAEHLLQFLQRRVRVLRDRVPQFSGIELPPSAPALLRLKAVFHVRLKVTVDRPPPDTEPLGRFGLGPAFFYKCHYPFAQINVVCFHARYIIILCANVNMKYYNTTPFVLNNQLHFYNLPFFDNFFLSSTSPLLRVDIGFIFF